MENENKQSPQGQFIVKNIEKIRKAEDWTVAIFALGFIGYFLKVPYSNIFLIIGSIASSSIYFFQAYAPVEIEIPEEATMLNSYAVVNFIFKLYFYCLSVCMVSMLGFVNFPNVKMMAIVSSIPLVLILLVAAVSRLKQEMKIYNTKFYIRIIAALFLLGVLAFEKGMLHGIL